MNLRLGLVVALAVGAMSASAAAQEQPWLEDRRYGEGIGIRAGNLEFHPGIAGEFGYDSNYFQRSDSEGPIDVLRLRITPSLSLSTLGARRRQEGGVGAPPTVNFRAGVSAAYNEFFDLESENSDLISEQRHVDLNADFDLDILPERPWGVDAFGRFIRTVEPSNSILLDQAFDRDTLSLGAGLNWRPGGGLFEWRLGYELRLNIFEREVFEQLNNTQHYIKARGRWRFLPRTALLFDGEYGFINYNEPQTGQNGGEVLQSRVGINGLVTNHFAVLAMAGWAQSYYEPEVTTQRNYDDLVAHAEVKWYVLPKPSLDPKAASVGLSSIAAGYVRNFQNSYFGDFYRRDRGYVDFEYFVGGVALLSLEAGIQRNSYPDVFLANSANVLQPSFGETRADVSLFGEYRFSDVFAMNSTLRYDGNLTDQAVPLDPLDPGVVDQLRFDRYQAWLGARLFW